MRVDRLFLALVVSCFVPGLFAQSGPSACRAVEHRQFDFWVGRWDLSWPPSETSGGRPGRGTNHIRIVLDGCAISEEFDGAPGMQLKGVSLSTFNSRTRRWQQTWVDNWGNYLTFVGEFEAGSMVLVRDATAPDGRRIVQRMVWKNIEADSLDWSWEQSEDGGVTWKVLWPIHYRRQKKMAAS